MIHEYSEHDFVCRTTWGSSPSTRLSSFDITVQSKWQAAVNGGYFRYSLNILFSKILPGKYSFLAQLNPDRALNRRTPDNITCLTQPFNSDKFNFTKIKDNEILFEIKKHNSHNNELIDATKKDFIIINVSPLEFGHSLLIPELYSCLPQVVTVHSLQLAVEVVLLSASPALRVGFNSLCGFATVNHLHYHLYYLQHCMPLESINVQQLSGPCYELTDYPAHGFVFQLSPNKSTADLARTIYKLTNHLQTTNIAHNLYITRGKAFDSQVVENEIQDTIRVYVWARKHSTGPKNVEGFDPALCELFGHLVVKVEAAYCSLTEMQVADILADICQETFENIRESVRKLFNDNNI